MLDQLSPQQVVDLTAAMDAPDDLLPVVDVVDFDVAGAEPRFAGYVAASWEQHAQDWPEADRAALRLHLRSEISQGARAEAIVALRGLVAESNPAAELLAA